MKRVVALLAFVLASGCAAPPPGAEGPVHVGPPEVEAGGFAPCATSAAQLVAVPLRAEAVRETSQGPGVHLEDRHHVLWVWQRYEQTPRDDRVSRLNEVQVFREPDGSFALCTRVEIVAPVETDGSLGSYAVAARIAAPDGFPAGSWRAVVNWVAGCACDPLPRGNTTGAFVVPPAVPEPH